MLFGFHLEHHLVHASMVSKISKKNNPYSSKASTELNCAVKLRMTAVYNAISKERLSYSTQRRSRFGVAR